MSESERKEPSEEVRGAVGYLEVLREIHHRLNPNHYLEIGVRHGSSLALAHCPAIGVDPNPEITSALGEEVQIFEQTSDDFFQDQMSHRTIPLTRGMAFIDGMHLFEFVLRDFMNVEHFLHPSSVVVIDDIFPNHPTQASRRRQSRVWTGDVWKILVCLNSYRPDLALLPLDTRPTGLLLVAGLDPGNTTLDVSFSEILEHFNGSKADSQPPESVLDRHGAVPPDATAMDEILSVLGSLGPGGGDPPGIQQALHAVVSNRVQGSRGVA